MTVKNIWYYPATSQFGWNDKDHINSRERLKRMELKIYPVCFINLILMRFIDQGCNP